MRVLASMLAIRTVWGDFGRFLRQPQLIRPSGLRARDAPRGLAAMIVLNILVLLALLPLMALWQKLTGIAAPAEFGAMPRAVLIPLVIAGAPIAEEMMFRGWLTGQPRALWLILCAVVTGGLLAAAMRHDLIVAGVALAVPAVALIGWLMLRRRTAAPAWFARRFGWIFYGAALIFGIAHVTNYPHPDLLTVPMVLPQLWSGLTLGYVRMRNGLTASILLHACSNGIALALAFS